MNLFKIFKKNKTKIKEEVKKEEIKQEIKSNIIYYDKVKNILYLDNIEYRFDIESEDRLQEFHKDNLLKLYKNENDINTFQSNLINSVLKLDRQVLVYILLSCQEKYKKDDYKEFRKYIYDLMDKHKIETTLFVYANEMYLRYLENGNFQNVLERGRELMQVALTQRLLNIIQTSPNSIKNIVNAELEKIMIHSQN